MLTERNWRDALGTDRSANESRNAAGSQRGGVFVTTNVEPTGWRQRVADTLVWFYGIVFFASLWAAVDLLWLCVKRLWTGTWSYISLGDAFAWLGLHVHHKVAGWPLDVIVLIFALTVFGAATDAHTPAPASAPVSKERKPMRLPGFLWPRSPHADTTVLIRMGRVVHWFTVLVAAGAFILALVIGWDSVTQAARTGEEARQWDIAHPTGRPAEGAFYDYRPYVADDYLGTALLVGACAAFSIAVTGRGIRYVLAGE